MNHYAKQLLSPKPQTEGIPVPILDPQDDQEPCQLDKKVSKKMSRSKKLRKYMVENTPKDELVKLEMRKLSREELEAIAAGDKRPMQKVKEALPEVFRIQYPKDKMLVQGILTLRKNKASERMPKSIQEACMVLAAAFTKAIPYFDRYMLYQNSVTVGETDLAAAYGVEHYEQIPKEMRNKLGRALKKANEIWPEELKTMQDFFNHQARHMDTWTDEELETVEKIEEVVLQLELDPAEIQTYLTPTDSTDPKYFFTTADLCRYLISMSKGVIQYFPLEIPAVLKAEGFKQGTHPDGRKGWFAIITKHHV